MIQVGDCRKLLRQMPEASVHCVVTSPPYWGLRDYGLPPLVWEHADTLAYRRESGNDGVLCEHSWDERRYYTEKTAAGSSAGAFSVPGEANKERLKKGRWRQDAFCRHCGAWRGSLGLEPTPGLFVRHLVEVMREVKRVLRDDGTVWLNLGSSYASGGSSASQSPPVLREPACGNDDKEPSSSQATDRACCRYDDECQADSLTHPHHIARTDQELPADGGHLSLTDRDSEHRDSEPASLGALPPDAQASTSPSSSDCAQGACDHVTQASTYLTGLDSFSPDVPACADKSACTGDTAGNLSPSGRHTLDKEPSFLASHISIVEPAALTLLYSTIDSLKYKAKDLVPIPWLVAIALQADGWYLRSDIIFSKTNPMPESVRDRPTKAHEYLFLLSKNKSYYYDAEAIKEDSVYPDDNRKARSQTNHKRMPTDQVAGIRPGSQTYPKRNKRTVWTLPTHAFRGAHFATFSPKLVEPCIKAGTGGRGCCPQCGAPFKRLLEPTGHVNKREPAHVPGNTATKVDSTGWAPTTRATDVWLPTCWLLECGIHWSKDETSKPIPCTVLDPFAGSGTVGLVAARLGRDFILMELSPEYAEMSEQRLATVQPPLFMP